MSVQVASCRPTNEILKSLLGARPGSVIPGVREIRHNGYDVERDQETLDVTTDDNRRLLVKIPKSMSGDLITKESVRSLIRTELMGLHQPMYGTSTMAYQAQQNAAYQQAQWAGGGGGGSECVSQLEAYDRAMLQSQQIDAAIKAKLALKKEPDLPPAAIPDQETEMSIEQGNNIVPDVNLTHVFKWAVVLVIALFLGRRVWDQFGEKITQNLHKALDHSAS